MDAKKVIEKLIKIAHNQQLIIEKLAQQGTRDTVVSVPDQSGHSAPAAPPANKLPSPEPTHSSAEAAVKDKMGPSALSVSKLFFGKDNLPKGADFRVQYVPVGRISNPTQLARIISDAVVAVQKSGNPNVPMGNFYVEQAKPVNLKL